MVSVPAGPSTCRDTLVASKINSVTLFWLLSLFLIGAFANASPPTVLVIGDSISAAYGMPEEKGWVSLIQKRLPAGTRMINASISGETTGRLKRDPR